MDVFTFSPVHQWTPMALNGHRFPRGKWHLNDKIKAEGCFFRNFQNRLGKGKWLFSVQSQGTGKRPLVSLKGFDKTWFSYFICIEDSNSKQEGQMIDNSQISKESKRQQFEIVRCLLQDELS